MPSSLSEQVEAAIGLCQLQAGKSPEYQMEYMMYNLGQFFVAYAELYEKERTKNVKDAPPSNWKYDGYRMVQALEALNANAGASPGVSKFVDTASLVFKNIQSGQNSAPQTLRQMVNANPPRETMLFRGQPDSTVHSPEDK